MTPEPLSKLVTRWEHSECQHGDDGNAVCQPCVELHSCARELALALQAWDAALRAANPHFEYQPRRFVLERLLGI